MATNCPAEDFKRLIAVLPYPHGRLLGQNVQAADSGFVRAAARKILKRESW